MKRTLLAVLLLFPLYSAFAQEKPVFDRMDVFGLEWVENPQISPDGNWVVYQRRGMDIMRDRRTSRLWIVDLATGLHRKLTSDDVDESSPQWSPDGSRIAYTRGAEGNGAEVFLYWVASGVSARLTQLERAPGNLTWSPDGTLLAFTMLDPASAPKLVAPPAKPKGADWADPPRVEDRLKHEADGSGYTEPGARQLYVVSAEGGVARQLTSGDFRHGGPLSWTPDGSQLLFGGNRSQDWEYDFDNSEVYSYELNSGRIRALTSQQGPDREATVSPDGRLVAFTGFADRQQTYQISRLYVMNLDGSNRREIETGLDRSVSDPVWAADGSGLYVQYDDRGDTKIGFIPLDGGHKIVAEQLGGTSIGRPYSGGSFSVAEDGTIAYTHGSPERPAELAVLGGGSRADRIVTDLNGDLLAHRRLGAVAEINYSSTVDGRNIQGWVVTPPAFDSTRTYPLLVENHGGPISNYGPWFSPEVQLYAAAGYVVFYPNPRGSTGYGEEFGNLLYHDYPGDDYQDVMDGVDYLLRRSYLSEDSLYVTGGSAGGIMSAWMIGKNKRFEAAAVVKPVVNWISKTLVADNYFGYANTRYPGQPWENPEIYWAFSPLSLVANVETPTLVMVGTADLRTPLSEAKQLYHALKLRKVPTMLVEIPGSYHFIANRPSQMITKVDHVLAWFARYRG